jgi:hypothetical protein
MRCRPYIMHLKEGEYLEKLVQVIEQLIAPDAVVEHNVHLPVLTSRTGRTVQCDIVIRSGKKSRETITIIEVQDRKKAVDVNDFRGWLVKLEEVGAQHLYCVSRNTFPESIKEMAALSGTKVKLITLKELSEDQMPYNFFKVSFYYNEFDVMATRKRETIFCEEQLNHLGLTITEVQHDLRSLKTNDLKFSFDQQHVTALSTLCQSSIDITKKVKLNSFTRMFGYDERHPLFYLYKDHFIKVKLTVEFQFKSQKVKVPVSLISYDQDEDGALAWILEGYYQSSQGPIRFKIPVTKNEDGYSMKNMFLDIPDDMQLSLQVIK